MRTHTNASIRSLARPFKATLVLATLLALLLSPQGLLAQTALSPQGPLTQANENPVEEGLVGLLGSGAYRAWSPHSRGKRGSVGGTCEFGTSTTYGASCQHDNGNAAYLGTDLSGVYGESINGHFGRLGTSSEGVYGENNNGNSGSLGDPNHGVYGAHKNGTYGYLGGSTIGVYGEHANGSYGFLGGFFTGVYGTNGGGFGYLGGGFYGAYGETSNGNFGYLGGGDYGVYAERNNGNYGALGGSAIGVYGEHGTAGNHGSLGGSFYGARGWNANDNRGYLGHQDYGVWGTGTPWAGYFESDVRVTGTLTEGSTASKIDHPLDPENQYLVLSAVESPDMMNVYDGAVTTDARGEAIVTLPAYFEALNRDFRYQLTVIGTFAQAIVAEQIQDNRFVVRTDQPRVTVSWQVTGIRQDPWAEANRLVVEEAKPVEERGYYLHPALYGQPETKRIGWIEDETPIDRQAVRQRVEKARQQIKQEHQRIQAEHERIQAERMQRPPRPRPDHER